MVIRPRLIALAAVVSLGAGVAVAQSPIPGVTKYVVLQQAMTDTLCSGVKRTGLNVNCNDPMAKKIYDAVALANVWAVGGNVLPPNCMRQPTYGEFIRCADQLFPKPQPLAWKGGGGSTGGGGAQYNGAGEDWFNESGNCDKLELKLDAGGNIIIPSYKLATGGSVQMPGGTYFRTSTFGYSAPGAVSGAASLPEASNRWVLHKANAARLRHQWFGVVNTYTTGGSQCAKIATVAGYAGGSYAPRQVSAVCASGPFVHGPATLGASDPEPVHKSCPDGGSAGGNFHFYGNSSFNSEFHGCTWYAPDPAAMETPDGYAINPVTTIPVSEVPAFPAGLPSFLSQCKINPALLAKLVDKLFKEAASQPGYDGPAYFPITEADARPGDVTVGDLNSTPAQPGDPTPAPSPNPDAPAPTPSPTASPPEYTDKCDFGLTGCDNPGTPPPEIGEPETGIMDPIFEWLPDLPSISLPTAGAQCPTWQIDASAFGGQAWSFTMDSHCGLFESNRSAISVVMVALFGLMAALIILRS